MELILAAVLGAYLAIGFTVAMVGLWIGTIPDKHMIGGVLWLVIAWPVIFGYVIWTSRKGGR